MDRYYWRPDIVDQVPLDGHCVIEASAGTGKTFTIEHLVVEILLNSDTRLDQILAVTFTEKAAGELRARIRATIEKPLRSEMKADSGTRVPLDLEKAGRLERALFSFERAPIHTIHSFCHRTLADFAVLSGTRLKLEVADARTMFHEAFRAELREHFAADEWMGPLLEEWLADDRGSDRLEALLFDANQRHYFDSDAGARNSAAADELLASFDYSRLLHELPTSRAKGASYSDLETITEAIKRSGHDTLRLRRELDAQALARIAALEHLRDLSPQTRRFLNAVTRVQFAVPLEARIIDNFLPPVARRLDRIKRERGVIDFGDMPRWLWSALEGPQGARLATILRQRFHVGLVDEFQDTDDLQWRIFRRIFVEGIGTRLLVVGDPKQAIYGFRDADVFTYLKAKTELLEKHGAAFVPLVKNFRSTAEAIDAVNLIFAPTPAPAFFVDGDIRYDHPVSCGFSSTDVHQSQSIKPISIFGLPAGAKLTARRYRAMLGRKIAASLKNLLEGNPPPEGTGQTAPAAPDVFVLTRTLMESREMAGYLREAGVRYAFYKQDGLFKTREAGHILDLLRAIAEPHRRSHRLKAWSTPFFDVPLRDLPGLEEVAPTHPLMARLLQWKALGDQGRFAELFSAMLHESGLAARELLLVDTQRELTNYEHVFEILLERALSAAPDLFDLIQMLASWVDGDDLPPGESPGVQRLESERDAVQIMTVHKAKGLQADIVVLFGGYAHAPPERDRVLVFHTNGERQVIAGPSARNAAKEQLANEESAENERLLYVALTRARKRLYLAMFPPQATLRNLDGYYRKLNERLNVLAADEGESGSKFEKLVEIVPLRMGAARPAQANANAAGIGALPEGLLSDDQDHLLARSLREIVARHRALFIDSYTSLQRRATLADQADSSIFKYDVDPAGTEPPLRDQLGGGRAVGVFLHEVIERLELRALADTPDFETWMARTEVRETIAASARRHQVSQAGPGLARGAQIVFNALRSPLVLGNEIVPGLVNCEGTREMEFTFPIPDRDHPLLGAGCGGAWTIDRGLLVGFVDFVFRFRGRTYFADWKSDLLPSYDAATIAAHVSDHYLIQARIYTVGIVRLLRIRDRSEYEERFGGLVYVFLRGVKPDGDGRAGAYFHRPSWDEIVGYERALMTAG